MGFADCPHLCWLWSTARNVWWARDAENTPLVCRRTILWNVSVIAPQAFGLHRHLSRFLPAAARGDCLVHRTTSARNLVPLSNARVLHMAPGNQHTHLRVPVTQGNPPSLSTKQLWCWPETLLCGYQPWLVGNSVTTHCPWLCRSWSWLEPITLGRCCVHIGCHLLGNTAQRGLPGDWRKGD